MFGQKVCKTISHKQKNKNHEIFHIFYCIFEKMKKCFRKNNGSHIGNMCKSENHEKIYVNIAGDVWQKEAWRNMAHQY